MRYATLLTSLSVIGSSISCCKKNKLNCHVIMSYLHWNSSESMCIVNGIILILMLLMIAMFSIDRFNHHKQRMIEICRKSPNKARQRPVPHEHEHGQAQWEEGPGLTIIGRVDQGRGGRHRRRAVVKDDQAQKSKRWTMLEELGEQATATPKCHL
jgi:hypothetical protein